MNSLDLAECSALKRLEAGLAFPEMNAELRVLWIDIEASRALEQHLSG